MNIRYGLTLLGASIVCAGSAGLQATIVDFETLPGGGVPTDNQLLTSTYTIDGVTLEFEVDQGSGFEAPVFEQRGQQDTGESGAFDSNDPGANPFGFHNATLNPGACATGATCPGIDTPAAGFESQLGEWFLRSPTAGATPTLRISYSGVSTAVTAASGEIWDIDGNANNSNDEQWQVTAFDSVNNPLGSVTSPLGISSGAPLDGLPWVFKFSGLHDSTGGISYIDVEYIGGGVGVKFVGLAFNNFSPTSAVPEPSSVALTGVGTLFALALAALRRRRRQTR